MVKKVHLCLGWMESVLLHVLFDVISSKSTVAVFVHTCKGVVDVEAWSPSELLLEDFNSLVDLKIRSEDSEEGLASLGSKELSLGNILEVDVLWLSLVQGMVIETISGNDGFTEVRVKQS